MRPWQLLAVLLLGAARSSFQASVQTHVRPWGGGDAIQPIQHDVELVVKPGAPLTRHLALRDFCSCTLALRAAAGPVGPTLLNFMTFGEDGGVFSWANMNNGTLRLERFGQVRPQRICTQSFVPGTWRRGEAHARLRQTLFEVARKVEAPDGVGVLLQEAVCRRAAELGRVHGVNLDYLCSCLVGSRASRRSGCSWSKLMQHACGVGRRGRCSNRSRRPQTTCPLRWWPQAA